MKAAVVVLALVALTAVVSARQQAAGGVQNQRAPVAALTVEEVILAADRLRADRWYPEETDSGDSHAGRLSRAADMDLLMLAVKHPSANLRAIGIRELGRFETTANIPFLANFLDDPVLGVRMAAADALVQSTVDRPDSEAMPAVLALEERLKREQVSPSRGYLWTALAQLPTPDPLRSRLESEWYDEILQLRPARHDAITALLFMVRRNPDRGLHSLTSDAVHDWAQAGLDQGSLAAMVGLVSRGFTIDFLRILQAIRSDDDGIAADAARFVCRNGGLSCGADIRQLGLRLLNPLNEAHYAPLRAAARDRTDVQAASLAVRRLTTSPFMPLCQLVDLAEGLTAEVDAIRALVSRDPRRYELCGTWSASQYLLNLATELPAASRGDAWIIPAAAMETLAARLTSASAASVTEDAQALTRHRESLAFTVRQVASAHTQWQARAAAARAAARLEDTASLAQLLTYNHPTVQAEALKGLFSVRSSAPWGDALELLSKASDHHLIITIAGLLKGISSPEAAREPLLDAFERLTRTGRDTSRRARLALLERLAEVLPIRTLDSDLWAIRLSRIPTDVDPVVAAAGAELIERMTGVPTRPTPTRRAPQQVSTTQLRTIPACITFVQENGPEWTVYFDRRVAPLAVARLVQLINSNHYSGTVLHRVNDDIAVGGTREGHDEGSLSRFIRDEVGAREDGHQLVLLGHDRDALDGRFAVRDRENPSRHRRETVLGRVFNFEGAREGTTITKVWVGAPEGPETKICKATPAIGIPPILTADQRGSR